MTWYLEHGIGEDRAVRIAGGHIVAARIAWPDELASGLVANVILASRPAGSARGAVRFPSGELAVVDKLPPGASEGSALRVEVTRPAIGEAGRRKLAQARPTSAPPRPAPSLAERLAGEGHAVRTVRRFPVDGFEELVAEALAGEAGFAGGRLVFSPTPAMLLVDIDGTLAPRALALAAVAPLAEALQRFDLGGSVGIDFPSLADKADRRAVDDALAVALAGWPHERTAMNGFGFVQLVARLDRPSLLHRATFERAGLAARMVMRRAERLEGAGAVELTLPPRVDAAIRPEWLDELARRTGREVRRRVDPGLAAGAGHAQLVPR